VRTAPLANLNVKTGPLPGLSFGTILLVSVDCCFSAFFGVLSGDFGFLYCRSIPDLLLFLNYFLSTVLASGLPSAKFLPGSNL